MNVFIDKNVLTVGNIIDFIEEMNIGKKDKVMYDSGDGPNIITSFSMCDDVITFTSDYKNHNLKKCLNVANFLDYVNDMDLNTQIAYFESDYITLDTVLNNSINKKKESAIIGIQGAYKDEDTGNLVFDTLC